MTTDAEPTPHAQKPHRVGSEASGVVRPLAAFVPWAEAFFAASLLAEPVGDVRRREKDQWDVVGRFTLVYRTEALARLAARLPLMEAGLLWALQHGPEKAEWLIPYSEEEG